MQFYATSKITRTWINYVINNVNIFVCSITHKDIYIINYINSRSCFIKIFLLLMWAEKRRIIKQICRTPQRTNGTYKATHAVSLKSTENISSRLFFSWHDGTRAMQITINTTYRCSWHDIMAETRYTMYLMQLFHTLIRVRCS